MKFEAENFLSHLDSKKIEYNLSRPKFNINKFYKQD